MPVGSILVYVTSHVDNALGENVLKLPLLLALGAGFPGARISWVPGTSGEFYLQRSLAPLVDGRIAEFITDLDIPVEPRAALRAKHPILKRHFDLVIDTQRYLGRTLFLRRIPHRRFISGTWRYLFSNARPPRGLSRRPPRLTDKLLGLAAAATGHEIPVPNPIPLPLALRARGGIACRQARPTWRWRPVRGSSTPENAGRWNPLSPWLGGRWNAAACRCFWSVPTNSTGPRRCKRRCRRRCSPSSRTARIAGRGPRPEPGRGTGSAGVGGGRNCSGAGRSAGRRRRANGFALRATRPEKYAPLRAP